MHQFGKALAILELADDEDAEQVVPRIAGTKTRVEKVRVYALGHHVDLARVQAVVDQHLLPPAGRYEDRIGGCQPVAFDLGDHGRLEYRPVDVEPWKDRPFLRQHLRGQQVDVREVNVDVFRRPGRDAGRPVFRVQVVDLLYETPDTGHGGHGIRKSAEEASAPKDAPSAEQIDPHARRKSSRISTTAAGCSC